jgi:hypothetical protein
MKLVIRHPNLSDSKVSINILEIYFFSTIKLLRIAPSE